MKFWRLSVRNRITALRSLVVLAAALLLSFVSACQRAQLAEYKPYAGDNDVPRVSVEDAKKDYDSGVAVIIDSRPEPAYAQEHVTGSINIPSGSPETEFSKMPQGKKIIVYCS
jgi:hypothetical protein